MLNIKMKKIKKFLCNFDTLVMTILILIVMSYLISLYFYSKTLPEKDKKLDPHKRYSIMM